MLEKNKAIIEGAIHIARRTGARAVILAASLPEERAQLQRELGEGARVFITPGGIFGSEGNAFIRVSLCSPEEKFDQAMERIKHFLKQP